MKQRTKVFMSLAGDLAKKKLMNLNKDKVGI